MQLRDNLSTETGWDIRESRFDPQQLVTNGSNYMVGNGYLGYRGTFPEWRKSQYVGCVVTDTYDNADGKWTELCTVPNGLFAEAEVVDIVGDRSPVSMFDGSIFSYDRRLNFRYGVHSRTVEWGRGNGSEVSIRDARFADYNDLHLVAATYQLQAHSDMRVRFTAGIDSDVWSLNGNHFVDFHPAEEGELLFVDTQTQERAIPVCVGSAVSMTGVQPVSQETRIERYDAYRAFDFDLAAGDVISFNQYMAVYTGNDTPSPRDEVRRSLNRAVETGYEALLVDHKQIWDARWERCHIDIEGDEAAQTVLRYCLYQNAIATPMHTDHLPIGARGLSCQAYQGAAFWDQEIFNLPVFLYTEPEIAKRILMFRYRTLDGARRKARNLGYEGAFYAWISSDSGDEICPSFFFKDVLTGRQIRNHFNDWQIHVAPDVAYILWKYWQATHDFDFMRDYGAEILFEVARFLWSRAFYNVARERYEYIRVLGPDEYHENVDNNPFTNVQARYVLSRALQMHDLLSEHAPDRLNALKTRVGFSDKEIGQWRDMVERLYVKQPDPETGVIEQFDGFFKLEDTTPEELKTRLQDPGEYWGWPNGVAVHTQVSKQADIAQMFTLHSDLWDVDTMKANFEYYEPRTQHGSSLSFSVYAMVAAWIGRLEKAHEYFMRSCTVDLFSTAKSVSGGTFIGGIHTAASGVSWQIVVFGFAGTVVHADGIHLSPKLPPQWNRIRFLMTFRGRDVRFEVDVSRVRVRACADNDAAVPVHAFGRVVAVEPGAEHDIPATG
ncbi:MAG: glycoside hydrolase family 65 protein [Spirochaetales bacterium]